MSINICNMKQVTFSEEEKRKYDEEFTIKERQQVREGIMDTLSSKERVQLLRYEKRFMISVICMVVSFILMAIADRVIFLQGDAYFFLLILFGIFGGAVIYDMGRIGMIRKAIKLNTPIRSHHIGDEAVRMAKSVSTLGIVIIIICICMFIVSVIARFFL